MDEVKGVREYNRIRRYMERIYLYGFLNREDFEKVGIGSAKDYDYVMALIRSIFPDICKTAVWQGKKKYVRFVRQYERNGENRLADSYLLRSSDIGGEIAKQLHILSALCKSPKTLEALSAIVELQCQEGSESDEVSTIATSLSSHRRRVDKLVKAGYIRKQKKEYILHPNLFSCLDDAELTEVYTYICFACGVTYPRVAGSYLRRSVIREFYRRGLAVPDGDIVLLRHNAKRCVFDEDVLYKLYEYIVPKTSQKGEESCYESACITVGGGTMDVFPITLRVDVRLGRWYLLAHDGNRSFMCRVSDIADVKAGKRRLTEKQRECTAEAVRKTFAAAGCSGAISDGEAPILVEALLRFEGATERYRQFQREMQIGSIQEQEGKLLYRVYINDPVELVPFLRSYSPWLKILPGAHGLDRQLEEDLRQMYGALKDTEGTGNELVQ